ncbi:hypothetical protein MVEN_02097100 [Mycena venus]|uniref:RanBP2-type domain-containing protein n=1 Tax=Mycena venus TaxID=2733690 RepID=A0A8H7CHL2_9AGAR|nr:hypothetical protein MVEN_02097100 [Mycena venus]
MRLGIRNGPDASELLNQQHMNHGPAFQALWKRFRAEVRALQDKGYYGDGLWSSGNRLIDSAEVTGKGIEVEDDFPEFLVREAVHTYSFGLAFTWRSVVVHRNDPAPPPSDVSDVLASHGAKLLRRTRRAARRPRNARPGGRVKAQSAFPGEGSLLAEAAVDPKGKGVGFRKQAASHSKRAREERALAVEKRIKALQAAERRTNVLQAGARKASASNVSQGELECEEENERVNALRQASTSKSSQRETITELESEEDGDAELEEDELDEDDEGEPVGETDAERRKALIHSGDFEDLLALNAKGWKDFGNDFNFSRHNAKEPSEPIELSSDDEGDDIPVASGSTFVMPSRKKSPHSRKDDSHKAQNNAGFGLGNMVQSEISLRKKESLGMAPVKAGSRVLGDGIPARKTQEEPQWACHMCTLLNKESFLACEACTTPRKQTY